MLKAAKAVNYFPRSHQIRRVRRIAREFQREVCFASGVQFRRAAGIDAPAAIGQLPLTHIVGQLGNALGIGFAKNVQIVDVVRFQRGIGLQLALPVALFSLKRKEVIGAEFNSFLKALRPILLLPSDLRRCDRWFLSYAGK